MPIFCEPIPEPTASTEDLMLGIGGAVSTAGTLQAAAEMLDSDPAETLVVIGPEVATSDALEFASALRLTRPAVGVILVREWVDVRMLTDALRAGVREVVPAGDRAGLIAACERSREVSLRQLAASAATDAVPAPEGRIVTVFAAKGGCGKTTFAVNLGVALATGTGQRVCVVDLDLAFGDVAISVQLDPARTIIDALPMAGHLDTTGAASLLTSYRPGLEMLLAPVVPGDAEKISPALVGELLAVLRGIFDYVVVDTPAQLSDHVLTAMDASAHIVLLTTPEVPALKNLRVTLDLLDMLSYPAGLRSVVLNRSDSKVGLGAEDVERVVRGLIAAQIPSSRDVPVSINKGLPIMLASPRHPVSQAITRFARQRLLEVPAAKSRSQRRSARRQRKAA
jgi:MinD-like ATPase involved in chromosome partitioning or flagellar assembly